MIENDASSLDGASPCYSYARIDITASFMTSSRTGCKRSVVSEAALRVEASSRSSLAISWLSLAYAGKNSMGLEITEPRIELSAAQIGLLADEDKPCSGTKLSLSPPAFFFSPLVNQNSARIRPWALLLSAWQVIHLARAGRQRWCAARHDAHFVVHVLISSHYLRCT